MGNDVEHLSLEFMGMITASVSHELQNVMAVINETSGLLQDVMRFQGVEGLSSSGEMTERSLSKITEQVAKGAEIIQALNRFSHLSEKPVANVNVCEAVLLFAFVTQRLFDRQGFVLSVEKEEGDRAVSIHFLLFCILVFRSLQYLGQFSEGELRIVASDDNVFARIGLRCSENGCRPFSDAESAWPMILHLCDCMDLAPPQYEASESVLTLVL